MAMSGHIPGQTQSERGFAQPLPGIVGVDDLRQDRDVCKHLALW